MNKYILIPFFLPQIIFTSSVKSQSNTNKISSDSAGYFLLNESKNMIATDSLNKAEELLNSGEKIAYSKEDNFLMMKIIFAKAELKYLDKKYNEAKDFYKKALSLSTELRDTSSIVKSLSSLSTIYKEIGLTDSAFYYTVIELNLNKARKAYDIVADNYRNLYTYLRYTLGGLSESKFITWGYLDSSLVYAKKSKKISAVIYATTNYAIRTYVDDPEKGAKLIQEAIDSARTIPKPNEPLVYALFQSYGILLEEGKYQQAEENLSEALLMEINFDRPNQLAHIYMLLGNGEVSKGNTKKALYYLRKAVYFCELENVSPLKRSVYTSIREVHRKLGNTDSTLYYLEKYCNIAEKIRNEAMIKQISLLSARYKVEEKENRIKLLDELNQQKKLRIEFQHSFIFTLAVAVVITFILSILIYIQYKRKQKAYLRLVQKNMEIDKKEKEIVRLNGVRRANIENKLEPLKIELENLFLIEKIYLDKDLHQQTVVSRLETNTSYLSTFINDSYKCSFTQFVNKYRVLEACEILSDTKNEIYTMEGIAEMSGFSSKSAFYKAFNEFTGLTPSTFRDNIKGVKE